MSTPLSTFGERHHHFQTSVHLDPRLRPSRRLAMAIANLLIFLRIQRLYTGFGFSFGDSFSESADRSEFFQAASVAKILEKLGIRRYSVIGTSYGGFVAYRMAAMWPERVENVVIASSENMLLISEFVFRGNRCYFCGLNFYVTLRIFLQTGEAPVQRWL